MTFATDNYKMMISLLSSILLLTLLLIFVNALFGKRKVVCLIQLVQVCDWVIFCLSVSDFSVLLALHLGIK